MRIAKSREDTTALRVVLLLGLLLALPIRLQAEQLPIKTYTAADGLPSDQISRIVQDSYGFLWFCTNEGLSRFDGYKFTNYSTDQGLPHRVVNDLLETRSGVYWIATGGGVCRFNPTISQQALKRTTLGVSVTPASESRFVLYHTGEDQSARTVNVLIEDRTGTLWCGTRGGLYRLEQSGREWMFKFVDIGLPMINVDYTSVYAMVEDRLGALWIGTGSGLYRRLPDGRTEHYTTRQGLPINGILALLEDREGQLWVGTTEGICRIVPEPDVNQSVVARLYTTKNGLPNNRAESLFQSSDGRLWVGATGGLSEFIPTADKDGQLFRTYTTANGLRDRDGFTLAEDRDGNLWIGTESGGAMKIARDGFTTFNEADGLSNTRIASILEDQTGQLCVISVMTGKFIHRFDGRRFTAVRPNTPKKINYFGWGWYQVAFQDRAGEWWVPSTEGLWRFPKVREVEQLAHTRPKAVYTTRDGLGADEVFRLFEDSRSDIWISTLGQPKAMLTRWERANETFHRNLSSDGIPEAAPTAFCEDASGNLWIGFYDGGLLRYAIGRFRFFSTADGVPAGSIRGLYLDHAGKLWVATTQGGMSRIDNPAADRPQFVTYTTADGLASNFVTCITEDQWGRIYAGTGRGVDRLDLQTGRIKHYTVADGLANNYLNVSFRDRSGALWFGTLQGLSRLIPEPDRPQPPPSILIGGLHIAGLQHPVSELGDAEVSGLMLGPNQNQIKIDFFSLGFGMGEVLRYQYRLEGTNQDWSQPTDERSINYANLSPGTYRFLVRAVNAEGVASPKPGVVAFTILPPIWQRWWFIALIMIGVGSTIYLIYRYRVARLIELERVRTRIATDLHDDIGSSLSQISVLSEVVRKKLDRDMRVSEPLLLIANLSRDLVDSMSDIVWAINPKRDRLNDLTQRMRRVASDLFTARNIKFDFRAPDPRQDIRLGADMRREIFLIFKESLNNMVRHSECTKAEVEFLITDGRLELKMGDNGRGFDPDQIGDGNGLVSMRQRAMKLGGVLDVISSKGQGTTVRLKAPLGRRK